MRKSVHNFRRYGAQKYAEGLALSNDLDIEGLPLETLETFHDVHNMIDGMLLSKASEEMAEEVIEDVEIKTEVAPPPPFTEEIQRYDSLTVAELKVECKSRELPVYGTKAELILRLKQNDIPEENESEGPTIISSGWEEVAPEEALEAPIEEEIAASEGEIINDEIPSSDGQEPIIEN